MATRNAVAVQEPVDRVCEVPSGMQVARVEAVELPAKRVVPPVVGVSAAEFLDLVEVADKLAKTGFLPSAIRTGAQAAAIILAGRELGMDMMRALRSLRLVEGNVQEMADSQLSRFKVAGGHHKWLTLTNEKAVGWFRHPNGDVHEETFTMEDARAAGITGPTRNGHASNYTKWAKAMLRSRCITAGIKSLGWEGGVGVYDPDEYDPDVPSDPNTEEKVAARLEQIDARRTDPTKPTPIATLAEAEGVLYPGPKHERNPWGGTPLKDVPHGAMRKLRVWLHRDTQKIEGTDDYDYATMSLADRATLLAHDLVMTARDEARMRKEEELAADIERATNATNAAP